MLQRKLEEAGISTVSISNVPEITYRVCVPRAVFIQYPFGRLLGDVGDAAGQRQICSDMLDMLATSEVPNTYRHLPYHWQEAPEDTRWRPPEPPPLGSYTQSRGLDLPKTLIKAMGEGKE